MRKAWMFLMALVIAGAAQAQMYKWVDPEGKVRYGDRPPQGVKATPLKAVQPGPSRGPSQASGVEGKVSPAPAEREQETQKPAAQSR